MSWDFEASDGGDKEGVNHIAVLSENSSIDLMINYGIYKDEATTSQTGLPFGTKLNS